MWRCSSAFGRAAPSIMRESSHDAERLSFGSADSEVTMPGQPIEIILMRELADHLVDRRSSSSTPTAICCSTTNPRKNCSVVASTRPA